ncbi:MAG: hypothetical protein AAF985_20270, partial [Bacteroidota bacterium]
RLLSKHPSPAEKRKRKIIVFLLLLSMVLVAILLLYKKVTALANFSIDGSTFLENEINREVDQLPFTLRFDGTSDGVLAYDWKVYKVNASGADTASRSEAAFDMRFKAIGQYVVQLKVTGENGTDEKKKILILGLSDSFKKAVGTQFETLLKEKMTKYFSLDEFKQEEEIREILHKEASIKLFYKGKRISEEKLSELLEKDKYSALNIREYRFDDFAKLKEVRVDVVFPERPSRSINSGGKVVVNPRIPGGSNSDTEGQSTNGDKVGQDKGISSGKGSDKGRSSGQEGKGSQTEDIATKCASLTWDLPPDLLNNKVNTKNLNNIERVYFLDQTYPLTYRNCSEPLQWTINRKKLALGTTEYTFQEPGVYKICLNDSDCKMVLVTYRPLDIDQKLQAIVNLPEGGDINHHVQELRDMMSYPDKQGAIDVEAGPMKLGSWVGEQIILKRMNPDRALDNYSITFHPKTGEILRITFR